MQALTKTRGVKRSYKVVEDNDPTGYKSKKAKAAKRELGISAVPMPTYLSDLNPFDFSLWGAIEERMVANSPEHVETLNFACLSRQARRYQYAGKMWCHEFCNFNSF